MHIYPHATRKSDNGYFPDPQCEDCRRKTLAQLDRLSFRAVTGMNYDEFIDMDLPKWIFDTLWGANPISVAVSANRYYSETSLSWKENNA